MPKHPFTDREDWKLFIGGERVEGNAQPIEIVNPATGEVLGEAPQRQDRIGVVPHLSKRGDPALGAALAEDPRLVLIDVTADLPATVDLLALADHQHLVEFHRSALLSV